MKENIKGALFIVAAMLIFGSMGIFVRFLTKNYGLTTLSLVFITFFIPGIILSLFFLFKNKYLFIIKKLFWFIVLFTIFDIFNVFFYFQAFITTTISNAVLTHYTAPIFVAILAPFLLREHLNKNIIFAILLGIIGILFIMYGNFSFQSKDFLGILYGTASGLMYGLVIISIRYISQKISVYSMRVYQTIIGSLILFPFIIKSNLINAIKSNPNLLILLIIYSILIGIIAVLMHWSGIKRVTSHQAGVLGYAEPLFASSFAFIFLSELPSLQTISGGILIILSGYLILKDKK